MLCSYFIIIIVNGFLFMCMTGQSVLFMNTHIHPRRTKKHLSPTEKKIVREQRETYTTQPGCQTPRTTNGKPWKQTVSEGLVHQAVIHELLVTQLQTISQFAQFRIFRTLFEIKQKRRRSGPENPTSASPHLSSPASRKVTVVVSYSSHAARSPTAQPDGKRHLLTQRYVKKR